MADKLSRVRATFEAHLTRGEQSKNIQVHQPHAFGQRRNETRPPVLGALTRIGSMLAAFATAVFLATLWMIAVVAVSMFGESVSKILAALKGRSLLATAPVESRRVAVRISQRSRSPRPVRVQPQLRAAA